MFLSGTMALYCLYHAIPFELATSLKIINYMMQLVLGAVASLIMWYYQLNYGYKYLLKEPS